jgi:hypothetical protein
VLDVVDGFIKQLCNVVVVEAVDDVPTVTVARYQAKRPQEAQLVRYRRLLHADRSGQFPHRARGLP